MTTKAKGTMDNPYTMSECDSMLDAGTWPGGYVKDDDGKVTYVMKSVTVYGYSGSGSGSGIGGSDFEFSTGSHDWTYPDTETGSDDGGETVTGNEGGTDAGTGGYGGGGHSNSGTNIPRPPKLNVPASLEKAGVRVVARRYIMTSECTVSVFQAQAYDQDGQKINDFVVDGYFLERPYDEMQAETPGSKKAIQPGDYRIIPCSVGQRFKWYLDGVPGRAGIAIHSGNKAEDSLGCLLAGTSLTKVDSQNYQVQGSVKKLNSLFSLFDAYGCGNISICIEQ